MLWMTRLDSEGHLDKVYDKAECASRKRIRCQEGRWAVAEDILTCRSVPWCLRQGCAYLPHFRALTQGSNKHILLRHRASAGRF